MKVSPAQPVTMDSQAGLYQSPRDCVHFLRTGTCRYGPNCRFNHPGTADSMQATSYPPQISEFPERIGQPDCQFYLKTGTCKFGPQCKYHHPQVKAGSARGPPLLNFVGLPMRPGEKECAFYLRTGSCKFGVACKFNHPEPSGVGVTRSATYPNSASLSPASVPSWPIARPVYFPGSGLPGPSPYMPVYASSPQSIPFNGGWNSYQSMGTPLSNGDHRVFFNGAQQHVGIRPGFDGSLNCSPRPEQPECQYYVQTGHCKFGASCKYQHPKSMAISLVPASLSPMGLPLRPGQPLCTFYLRNGICKFGPVCRFDHPIRGPPMSSSPSLPLKEAVKVDESATLPKKNCDNGLGESSEDLQNGHDSAAESTED
eukprot:c10469_g1_i1 orf=348-1457(-)